MLASVLLFSVVSTIPKIVCETLAALGLQEEIPSWKIMDNKGKITVVLHWEKEHPPGHPPQLQVKRVKRNFDSFYAVDNAHIKEYRY